MVQYLKTGPMNAQLNISIMLQKYTSPPILVQHLKTGPMNVQLTNLKVNLSQLRPQLTNLKVNLSQMRPIQCTTHKYISTSSTTPVHFRRDMLYQGMLFHTTQRFLYPHSSNSEYYL